MSTTNQPGAGPHWPADAAHGGAPDDHAGGGGVNPEAMKLGHEPDLYAVKPILAIPLAVVVTFVVGFSVAAGVFAYFMTQNKPDPMAHPEGLARGNAPLNERLDRINRKGATNIASEVDQPRLEPLKRLQGGDKAAVQVTTQPEAKGNVAWIHPEDIQPSRVPNLNKSEFVDKEKKTARIPIADAIRVLVADKAALPVQAKGSSPQPVADQPTNGNAGRGGLPAAPRVEAAPAPVPKADEKKQ